MKQLRDRTKPRFRIAKLHGFVSLGCLQVDKQGCRHYTPAARRLAKTRARSIVDSYDTLYQQQNLLTDRRQPPGGISCLRIIPSVFAPAALGQTLVSLARPNAFQYFSFSHYGFPAGLCPFEPGIFSKRTTEPEHE
jgi:hypothetical protein